MDVYNKKCKNVHRYEIKPPLNTCKSLILIILIKLPLNVCKRLIFYILHWLNHLGVFSPSYVTLSSHPMLLSHHIYLSPFWHLSKSIGYDIKMKFRCGKKQQKDIAYKNFILKTYSPIKLNQAHVMINMHFSLSCHE